VQDLQKTCEWGAIRGPKILKSELRAPATTSSGLYLDQQKCRMDLIPQTQGNRFVSTPG